MARVCDLGRFLEEFAPHRLAEDWDNVGLLVGDPQRNVGRLMTCLTITPASVEEAIAARVDLIVSHHPLPFHALSRLTTETLPGRMLLGLIAARIGVYSPHTAFDSAAVGINQQLAESLGLEDIRPLVRDQNDPQGLGAGRWGRLPAPDTLGSLAARLKRRLNVPLLQQVGPADRRVTVAAVACGSAGQFLSAAQTAGCGLLVVGEARFHTCVEAEASGMALLLPGHYASERFAVEYLAEVLAQRFPEAEVWASRAESDPLRWV